jgi:imidazolonepropionase-like amidohydrolase
MIQRFFLIIGILVSGIHSQTAPPKDLHTNPPRTWALTNGVIHLTPEKTLENGTILLRNGIIEAVGETIPIPPEATFIDLKGKHVYAGFLESWLDVKTTVKDTSLRDNWNSNMRAFLQVMDQFKPKKTNLEALQKLGFTVAHLTPQSGIFEGQSALVQLSGKAQILNPAVGQVIDFHYGGWGAKEYPTSLLGAIAFIRQGLYDAQWYGKALAILKKHPEGNEPIQQDRSLAALNQALERSKPFIFRTRDELYSLRAGAIADEFDLTFWLKGNGYEYRRIQEIGESDPFIILPLNFPGKPNVADPQEALQYTTEQLKHWDLAPDNPLKLLEAGYTFSLTSSDLKDRKQFRKNLIKTVQRGFPKQAALAALTTIPAEKFQVSDQLGKIEPGYLANLTVVEGDYFESDGPVRAVWIDGDEFVVEREPLVHLAGKWSLKVNDQHWQLEFRKKDSRFSGMLKIDTLQFDLQHIELERDRLSWSLEADTGLQAGVTRFSGTILEEKASGQMVSPDGAITVWTATLDSAYEDTLRRFPPEKSSDLRVVYPEGAFGLEREPNRPHLVLVNDATIWTCGPKGILKGWDILFQDGKVKRIARNISISGGKALVIDGRGKHVTPGIIDAHSHMAGASINEGFESVTAEVRMQDVINSDAISLYRGLAGGLTVVNLLHGSANPIGGQTVILRLRWGSDPKGLIFRKAPTGIKLALGENVKRSNWNDPTNRYPKTRMGVEQIIRDAFQAAVDYRKRWQTYNRNSQLQRTTIPPRRNLELEALVEILEGKREVNVHSYRQDEILMMTRIAEDFGFKVGIFQHVLEGYKVAERIKEHGGTASTFSDWWNYKYEVIDAIPYNGALMHQVGVNVSFNSDSDELARRLNLEAAKAVKYGNLSEEEALKLVTINPARQLKIDRWVGSLEVGKDADFVIWSGHPLSTYTVCEQTWIQGRQYFSREQDQYYRERDAHLRQKLIQKILKSPDDGNTPMIPDNADPGYYSCTNDRMGGFIFHE